MFIFFKEKIVGNPFSLGFVHVEMWTKPDKRLVRNQRGLRRSSQRMRRQKLWKGRAHRRLCFSLFYISNWTTFVSQCFFVYFLLSGKILWILFFNAFLLNYLSLMMVERYFCYLLIFAAIGYNRCESPRFISFFFLLNKKI